REWFEAAQKTDPAQVHFAIETLDGRHIGNSGLFKISHVHGTAESGTLIGDPADRRKGYGTDSVRVRAHYAFSVLGLRMLFSGHFGGNEASARMQEKAGYVVVGTRPKSFWKRGEYRDMVQTMLTRERFYELNPGMK
ncbi:MAG TPA: GNAT family protein, partial [Fimbriimonadaceae bacterium]|nr:GNAT family protein [Fimbriimonadaceae bacterium]